MFALAPDLWPRVMHMARPGRWRERTNPRPHLNRPRTQDPSEVRGPPFPDRAEDYFLKMDWEVHLCSRTEERSYRPAEELITEAAQDHEQKAPKSAPSKHQSVLGGWRMQKERKLVHNCLSEGLLFLGGWKMRGCKERFQMQQF